jgi:hypothetical protein
MKTKERCGKRSAGVALTSRSAGREPKNADLKVGATEFREQSENVYENKGALQNGQDGCPYVIVNTALILTMSPCS